MEKSHKVIYLLEEVLAGRLEADAAIEKWPDIDSEQDDLIAVSWHDLTHFASDEDARSKDAEYNKYQRDLLKKRIAQIKEKYFK